MRPKRTYWSDFISEKSIDYGMKIYTPLLIIIAILFTGCVGNRPHFGSTCRVIYTCPEGWLITNELDYGEIGHYSACEKDRENSSGVFVLSWLEGERGLNESLVDMRDNLKGGYDDEGTDIKFSKPQDAVFKGHDALVLDYGFSIGEVVYQGKIIAFNCNGKSVVILSQEAVKDHDKYLADFGKIGDSVECDDSGG